MRRISAGFVVTVLLLVVAGYLGYGALLWRFQEAMMFPAPGGIGVDALDQAAGELGVEPIRLEAADGTPLYGWYRSAGGTRALLYFHGNAETVAAPVPLMRLANQKGWDFGVIALRGYPGSGGSPGEEGFAQDAAALWEHVTARRQIPADRIVLHGRSLGGAVAARLAGERGCGGLVLESSFTSMVAMARAQAPLYPVERLLRHRFDTIARAPSLAMPAVVLHGDADEIIPVAHGRALGTAIPGSRYVEVPGGTHNELLVLRDGAARQAWLDLLAAVAAAP